MTAFSTPFGRLHSIRRRGSRKKEVLPIDVDAAKQYDDAGPCSAASSSLLTPRPCHYRSSTPSPATPAASSFTSSSGSSSTRFVSSPTFVSSSAIASSDLDALTPPLSPVHPNSAAATQATKSPLRRAFSRTFFFGSSASSNTSANAPAASPQISSPIPAAWDNQPSRAPRPARPARPATSPATNLSPNPNAFGFTASAMTRSQTSCPVIITTGDDVTTRRRSRTLMPPASVVEPGLETDHVKLSTSQPSASPTWSVRFSPTPSPLPFVSGSAPVASTLSSSPHTSLKSIRQMHARKSSNFNHPSSANLNVTPEWAVLSGRAATPDAPPPRIFSRRRLIRRASEESFHCRGPGFDAPPAADTRPSVAEPNPSGFYTRQNHPRSMSMYTSSPPNLSHGDAGARRMSDFTLSSYQEATKLYGVVHVDDILSEVEAELDAETALAGLGLGEPLPAAPRVMPKRLSATSQISISHSIPSSSSTISLSSVEQQLNCSWPDIPTAQSWFSACPPTPPASIRLQLQFRSLPPPSPALLSSSPSMPCTEMAEGKNKARPLSGIFISSISSVLDLKEAIAARMHELGYRLSPKNLTLTLHLDEDLRTNAKTALGLKLSAYGKNPAKVLDDSSRLLFEEGAQEGDLVVVDCDPSHILWSI